MDPAAGGIPPGLQSARKRYNEAREQGGRAHLASVLRFLAAGASPLRQSSRQAGSVQAASNTTP